MDYISSKNISQLMIQILRIMNPRILSHEMKVAYFLSRMLEKKGGFEKYEIAELALLALFHDVGALQTDAEKDLLHFEFKEPLPHSIGGYLFLKYASPFGERSKALLYHHTDWSFLSRINFSYKTFTAFLNLAEKIVIYSKALGDKFDPTTFEKYRNTKFSAEALDTAYAVIKTEPILANFRDDLYLQEIEQVFSYLIFTNEEKVKYVEFLLYLTGLNRAQLVMDTVSTMCICNEVADRMGLIKTETEYLHYAALLHDLGMISVPDEILMAPRKLNQVEVGQVRKHMLVLEDLIQDKFVKEIVTIAMSHHERMDGSGYPKGIREFEMNRLEKILQVADTVTSLTSFRPYRDTKTKEQVLFILKEEVERKRYSRDVVDIISIFYDEIINSVKQKQEEVSDVMDIIRHQFEVVLEKFGVNGNQE